MYRSPLRLGVKTGQRAPGVPWSGVGARPTCSMVGPVRASALDFGAIRVRHGKERGRGGPRKGIYSRGAVKIKGNYVTLVFCKRSRNVSN